MAQRLARLWGLQETQSFGPAAQRVCEQAGVVMDCGQAAGQGARIRGIDWEGVISGCGHMVVL